MGCPHSECRLGTRPRSAGGGGYARDIAEPPPRTRERKARLPSLGDGASHTGRRGSSALPPSKRPGAGHLASRLPLAPFLSECTPFRGTGSTTHSRRCRSHLARAGLSLCCTGPRGSRTAAAAPRTHEESCVPGQPRQRHPRDALRPTEHEGPGVSLWCLRKAPRRRVASRVSLFKQNFQTSQGSTTQI